MSAPLSNHDGPARGIVHFAVTGATGWLGHAVVEHLAQTLGHDNFEARVHAFASRPQDLTLDAGPTIAVQSIDDLPNTPHDILMHFAFLTRDRAVGMGIEPYVTANLAITGIVLSAIADQHPSAIAYASSGAVYQVGGTLRENPYAMLKRVDELAIRQAARDVSARSIIARVFNVAGPWITKPSGYALGDLINQALSGAPVRIFAEQPVLRSYVDVTDLAELLVGAALEEGEPDDVVFDTVGDEIVEVGDLARRIGATLGIPELSIERKWNPSAPPDRYLGEPGSQEALSSRLGVCLRPLEEQIRRTADHLASTLPSAR